MKIIDGDLVLEKDTIFKESIQVVGDISGKNGITYNLQVKGDILAHNISAHDISAHDILAHDILAHNISAHDILAHNISAHDISAMGIFVRNSSVIGISANII